MARDFRHTYLKGIAAGLLVTVAFYLVSLPRILPDAVSGILLLSGGGFTAGLFTKGGKKEGAVAGALLGGILAVIALFVMMAYSLMSGTIGPPLTDLSYFLGELLVILAILLPAITIPISTVAGYFGVVARNVAVRSSLHSRGVHHGFRLRDLRGEMGIALGSIVIVGAPFILLALHIGGDLAESGIFIPFFFGAGVIAGVLSRGGWKAGLVSGVITAVCGIGLLSIPLIWIGILMSHDGFVAGLGGIVFMVLAILILPIVTVGGVVGAIGARFVQILVKLHWKRDPG